MKDVLPSREGHTEVWEIEKKKKKKMLKDEVSRQHKLCRHQILTFISCARSLIKVECE